VSCVLQVLAEPGAPAAGALDPEHDFLSLSGEAVSPARELAVAGCVRIDRELSEELSELVERYRDMALLMGVYPNCDHRPSPHLLVDLGDVEAAGQSCVELCPGFYEVTAASETTAAAGDKSH
jgi:hypothetical protein